ncbi:EAL domain-containing protein [Blastococcus tunisiensis]|uniref:EAL domain, c-di-GMP-specific phosphodiesterase class I (Or its enzymatically inactive variant) n=1 Tax=Blastococcus tunisiensis TaxID=1798228 RepID=A0A1I1ZKG7_9ACTN|nr:EAL domain-containing protein [Blastococcus sp. DSM 46838]SFE32155.1 EAL domain, c-di-GMP-specific phosphodiesterase class I (or its enzymatically inactive variant) [Blastococcus sp. DSM 46838]
MRIAAAIAEVTSIAEAETEDVVLSRTLEVAQALCAAPVAAGHLTGPDGAVSLHTDRGLTECPGARTTALLVPLTAQGQAVGELTLGRPAGARPFTPRQRSVAEALGRQAGAVLTRLRQHRAGQDLLDGLGLTERRADDDPRHDDGYSPVVHRLLATARAVLGMPLTFLSRIEGDRQTFVAVDADGGPDLAPGTTIDAADGYCTLLLAGTIPAAVPDVPAHPLLGAMPVTADLGVGAYCGVPVRRPDGSVYGTLCGLGTDSGSSPTHGQIEALTVIAGLIGHSLAQEEQSARRSDADRAAFGALVDGPGRSMVVQPIVELDGGRVVGFEALSRFRSTDGAAVAPDQVFRQSRDLGFQVYLEQQAARSALALLPLLPADTYLSVNFSPATLLDPVTAALLDRTPPGRLVVELTEHEEVVDYATLRQALAGLRARGLRIAIDDTGAGFASLQHLTQLAPDIIKLDVAFVRDVEHDPACRAIARAIAGYAEEMGVALVAEGIETAEQAATLRRLGARFGQGYHFGRPEAPAVLPAPRRPAAPRTRARRA